MRLGKVIWTGIAVVMLPAIAISLLPQEARPPQLRQSAEGKAAAHDAELVRTAKQVVRAKLRDPLSAEFDSRMHVVRPGEIVCGMVNARNGFGGYTGFKRFIFDHGMLFSEEGGGKPFLEDWTARCVGK